MNMSKPQANIHILKKSVTLQKKAPEQEIIEKLIEKNNGLLLVLSSNDRKDFRYFSFGHCDLFLPIGIEYAIM